MITTLRVGLRLAGRELRRQPGRAALVMLMIAIPTAGATVSSVMSRTGEWSADAQRRANLGTAESSASFIGNTPSDGVYPGLASGEPSDADVQRLRDALPPDARVEIEHTGIDRVRLPTATLSFTVSDANLNSHLGRGRYRISEGRAPRVRDEAAISTDVARILKLRIGSSVAPERVAHRLKVVGVVSLPPGYGATDLVFTHDVPPRAQTTALISTPLGVGDVPGWGISGWQWNNRSVTSDVLWSYVGATVGLFVVGVIVAAAFALGARRQLRTIGLLSSCGASPRVVAATLAAQGFVAGAGSLVGIGVGGVGVGLLPRHVLYSITNQDVHGPVVRVFDLLPLAILGVVAATIAAWFPARTASRLPTLQALASRRPVATPRRGTWFWSAGALALSAALIVYGDVAKDSAAHRLALIAGFVLPLAAALWVAPIAVRWLETAFTDRSLAWRLAGRSLARNGPRSASVVGAACAVVGLVVGATTLIASWDTQYEDAVSSVPFVRDNQALLENSWQFQPTSANESFSGTPASPPVPDVDPSLVRQLRAAVPRGKVIPLSSLVSSTGGDLPQYVLDREDATLYSQYSSSPIMSMATPELLALFDVPTALRRRDAIVVEPPDGPTPRRVDRSGRQGTFIHVAAIVRSDKASLGLPRILLSPSFANRLGWQSRFSGTVAVVADTAFTNKERQRLTLLESDIAWAQDLRGPPAPGTSYLQTSLTIGTGRYRVTNRYPVRAIAFGGACVLVLAVVAVGLVLNARDGDDERAVLAATGVVPRVSRNVGTRKAALIVMTATVIAIPLAVIPVAILVTTSDNHPAVFRVDWVALGAMIIGLPLVVSAATALGGYARDVVRPRRPVLLLDD
ncbi:MAG: putative transport system permease protein [Actinomycetota bacterium]